MKPIRKAFGYIGRNYIPIKSAIQADNIKNSLKDVTGVAKNVFKKQKPEHEEAFDEALGRLSLSETDIVARYDNCKLLFRFFFVLSLFLLGYSLYLFSERTFNSGLLCAAVTLLFSVCSFKYHFWMFQIKERRLGCTVSEWSASVFGGEAR